MQELFRREAREATQTPALGRIVLVRTLPQWLMAGVAAITILTIIICIVEIDYTKHQMLPGAIHTVENDVELFAPANGSLEESAIEEGQQVKKGQVLFTFATDHRLPSGTSSNEAINQELRSKKQLLTDEQLADERSTDTDVNIARTDIFHLTEQSENLLSQYKNLSIRIEHAREQVGLHEKLKNDGFEADQFVQEKRDELNELLLRSQDIARQQSVCAQQLQDRRLAMAQLTQRRAATVAQFEREQVDLERQLTEQEVERTWTIVAPIDGTIVNVIGRVGQSMASGTTVVQILPKDGLLDAILYASSAEIGRLKLGQSVNIRVSAFPHIKYGTVEGQITEIAAAPIRPSEIPSERIALPASVANTMAYPVRIRLKQQSLGPMGQQKPLRTGMEVEGIVALDKRKLYEWLIQSLSNNAE